MADHASSGDISPYRKSTTATPGFGPAQGAEAAPEPGQQRPPVRPVRERQGVVNKASVIDHAADPFSRRPFHIPSGAVPANLVDDQYARVPGLQERYRHGPAASYRTAASQARRDVIRYFEGSTTAAGGIWRWIAAIPTRPTAVTSKQPSAAAYEKPFNHAVGNHRNSPAAPVAAVCARRYSTSQPGGRPGAHRHASAAPRPGPWITQSWHAH